jgi:hypothetical protein
MNTKNKSNRGINMRKISFQSRVFRWALFCLMAIVLLFAFGTQNAKADIKAVEPFYAWDRGTDQFKNSNLELWRDPDWWIPMIHHLDSDNDDYANACGSGTTTDFAGTLTMGLGNIDTTGGDGFQASRNWTIVQCDRTGDGLYNNDDLRAPLNEGAPLYGFTEWSGVNAATFYLISQDIPTQCTTNTCAYELLTSMFINLDPDCDNSPGDNANPIPAGGLCFYAEAQPPAADSVPWAGNLQARINAGGGDKTVNFNVAGPTAVELVSIEANTNYAVPFALLAGALILLFSGGAILAYKRSRV